MTNPLRRLYNHVIGEKSIPKAKKQTSKSFGKVRQYEKHLKKMRCPQCDRNGDFYVLSYELGKEGWETKIRCKQCGTLATINHTGFKFDIHFRGETQ